jgi:copper transport protein
VNKNGYRLEFHVQPNRAAGPNAFSVRITQGGKPVRGAKVVTTFTMLDMEMGDQTYQFREVSPGLYRQVTPALVMVGHWGLSFQITPPGGEPFTVLLVDHASG